MFLLGLVYVVLIVALLALGGERGMVALIAGGLAVVPAVRLGQARAARDGRPRGDARPGARAARDDRPPVRAGRPAQAEGRRRRHPHAERVRARPLAEVGDRLRDHRDHGAAVPRRARGRDGARAHPRRQPRRAGDDARRVLRDDRRLHRPVRLPVRRRPRRRRRQPERDGALPRLDRRLRRLVLPHAGAVALPRVRRRPRRRADHRPPERARVGAAEDLQRHGPDPAARPARQQELEAFYIFPPGAGKALGGLFSTHPPMEKRIAALQRLEMQLQGTACLRHGLPRHPHRQAQGQAAGREPAVRDVDRRDHARDDARAARARARRRSSSSRSPPPTSRRS